MRTPALLLALAALPLAAQTTKPPVHHTTAVHHTTPVHHAAACAFPTPILPAKIPALPTTAPRCPAAEYSLTYIDTKIGDGELAQPHQWYTVRYTGYLPDGTKFDSSYDHPGAEPLSFPYGAHQVITGWDTGFEGMHIGGKRRIFVPYQLAYGELGRPPVIPPRTMLIFDVELVAQSPTRPVPPPATPPAAKPAPEAKPAPPSPAGAAAPPPVTSTTPATSTQPQQPASSTPPKN
jgi:peptidylprolyl isomerase